MQSISVVWEGRQAAGREIEAGFPTRKTRGLTV